LELNANTGQLNCLENGFTDRTIEQHNIIGQQGVGRELFAQIRPLISQSELGASFII
jgi:hypothetical protein